MNRKFTLQKGNAMRKLNKAKSENLVDVDIIPLLDYINSLDDFYTTSSCEGRICVFCHVRSKLEDYPVGKWHRKVTFEEIMDAVNSGACSKELWFRQEASIFHIVSKTLDGASKMLDLALKSGYRRSGIQVMKEDRYMIEIVGTERIDNPIMNCGKLLVSEDYIRYLVECANKKMESVQEKRVKFEQAIKENLK